MSRTCAMKRVGRELFAGDRQQLAQPPLLDGARQRAGNLLNRVIVAVKHQRWLVADNLRLAAAARHPHDDPGAHQFSRSHAEVLFAHAVNAIAMRRHQRTKLVARQILANINPRPE